MNYKIKEIYLKTIEYIENGGKVEQITHSHVIFINYFTKKWCDKLGRHKHYWNRTKRLDL